MTLLVLRLINTLTYLFSKDFLVYNLQDWHENINDIYQWYTGWLKLKYLARTKCNFSTTVWDFYTQISWFIWERSCYNSEIKKNYFSFHQSYGYINILCHIFNSARNNQQQLVIFIHVMVSAGVCFGRKEILHFIQDKTKVNAKLYIETLLPEHVQDCRSVLPSGFIFQQDGTPAVCRRAVLSNPVLSWLKTG